METNLKNILIERGLKQTWLAEKTGISYSALSLLVSGRTEPTLKTARKIAKVLGMSIEELWPEDEENFG